MHRILPLLTAALMPLACTSGPDAEPAVSLPLASAPTLTGCVGDGRFRAELYGELRARLDWHGAELRCEGMPRPHGAGARLRFAGPAAVDNLEHRLAFIVALPDLQPGATARELAATVTLIDEDNGRFFSNTDTQSCWADVVSQQPLADTQHGFAVSGIVYCVAPLAALNSTTGVAIRNLEFAGRIDWQGDH